MARKKKKKVDDIENEELAEDEEWNWLHPDTKKAVLAIILIAVSLILFLSAFAKAGPAGDVIYKTFSYLFGIGYYIFPILSLILAGIFLISGPKKVISRAFIGASLFTIAGLGFIDIISPKNGGLVGLGVGSIESLFGYIASLIITLTLIIIASLITLNTPLRFPSRSKSKTDTTTTDNLTAAELKEIAEADSNDKDESENETAKSNEPNSEIKSKSAINFSAFKKPKPKIDFKNYVPPDLSLLKTSTEKATAGDLRANANIIKRTFESFNIPVEMGEINVGPKVTRYTLKPAEGVKLSKIVALNQDLALALAAHPIRIEAPIPGKSLVGIEVPNKTAAIVRLANLISTPEFSELSSLGLVIGRDVTGEPVGVEINKMPHMLIAGATGSGKSVTLHSIIVSLLYKNSPETLRLILIDPKRVELTVYEDIPHLIAPVVTQNKKAVGVFRWAITEMEKRYEMLQNAGARDIASYNEKIEKKKDNDKMPYIMIIVDELADLMSSYGKEVESYIVRLSQMARAVGLHLILATQRPSVEVITGLIKANITTRLALKVASQIDSRTILDSSGAESLLGHGDMLITGSNFTKPKRIQGALITEDEIQDVANFIRDNNSDLIAEDTETDQQPVFIENDSSKPSLPSAASTSDFSPSFNTSNDDIFAGFNVDSDEDDMLPEAVTLVRESQKASASLLQRRLKVGYARAARLLDLMEEKGIVGPGEGAKPREVYITNDNNPSHPDEYDKTE